MKRGLMTVALAGIALSAVAVARPGGDAAKAPPAKTEDPTIAFERYVLDNGMEVILHQDNSVPLVAVDLWYHVGARNERPGRSGFAHLFEHMLFQGAEHIGEDVHFEILRKIGASTVNGSTSFDRTNYYEVVPSHQLETALWLESDRMGYFLPLLTKESFENQVEVVRNERRQNYDNQPYRGALFPMFEALYPEGHPHRHLVIGKHEHLAAASVDDVRAFYKTWYVPANATLVIAGDFETELAKQLVAKYFGSFPGSGKPALVAAPAPALAETKRITFDDEFAKLRQINYVWHAPAKFAQGSGEVEILADVLGRTGTGRLYKLLVVEKELAQSVNASAWSLQDSGLFFVEVTLKSDADLTEVEKLVNAELAKLLAEPITDAELARMITRREAAFVWQLESLFVRAETLQTYNHYLGQPDMITFDLDRYRKATPASVLATAKTWLSKPRVEVLIVPAGGGK